MIYGIITYWMTDQPAEFDRFMIFITVIVQTALVGQALGLVIGAATELEVNGVNLCIPVNERLLRMFARSTFF